MKSVRRPAAESRGPGPLPRPAAAETGRARWSRLRRRAAWIGPLGLLALVAVALWYFAFRDTPSRRVERIVGEAREALALFEYGRAEELLRRALEEFPDSPVLHHNLGILHLKQERYEAAREEFARAAESYGPEANEVRAEEYFQLAQIDVRMRRFPEAERVLENAIAAHPTRAPLHTWFIDLQLGFLRNPAQADSSTRRFLRLCGRTPKNLGDAAMVHYRRRSYQTSTALALEAAQAADTLLAAHVLVAKSYWKAGRSEEGLRYIAAPLQRYPRAPELWAARGSLEIGAARYDDAIRSLDRALEIDPRHYESHRAKMMALFNANRLEEALAQAEVCLEMADREQEKYFVEQQMSRIRSRMRGEKEERVRIAPELRSTESPGEPP